MNDQKNAASEKNEAETAANNSYVLEKFRADYYSGKREYSNALMISASGILLYADNKLSMVIVFCVFIVQAFVLALALAKSKTTYLPLSDETLQRHIKILKFEGISSTIDILCLVALGVAAVAVLGKVEITISASWSM